VPKKSERKKKLQSFETIIRIKKPEAKRGLVKSVGGNKLKKGKKKRKWEDVGARFKRSKSLQK